MGILEASDGEVPRDRNGVTGMESPCLVRFTTVLGTQTNFVAMCDLRLATKDHEAPHSTSGVLGGVPPTQDTDIPGFF